MYTDISKTGQRVDFVEIIQTEISEKSLKNNCGLYLTKALATYKATSFKINANLQQQII